MFQGWLGSPCPGSELLGPRCAAHAWVLEDHPNRCPSFLVIRPSWIRAPLDNPPGLTGEAGAHILEGAPS